MKKIIIAGLAISFASAILSSCQDNRAANTQPAKDIKATKEENKVAVKTDGPAIGTIETGNYLMKLHQAFPYKPAESAMMANWTPKEGYRFIYLDVSLKNKGNEPLDGGAIFIALKVTDKNGVEYKKPAAALAGYTSDHPEASNQKEYEALWEKFEPNEFHREIIYAVEVPEDINEFTLSLPADRQRKEWKQLSFSL